MEGIELQSEAMVEPTTSMDTDDSNVGNPQEEGPRLSANDWCDFEEISKPLNLSEMAQSGDKFDCECTYNPETDVPSAACGEDCLNRQIMIECEPKRCRVGVHCQNRRFQKGDKAACELFKTERKGWGLRATEDIQSGDFIYEYCGEIYTQEEFEKRQVQYHEDGRYHYYFMSLDADYVIDATLKGSLSRFINHSCEPNAETQKWTVHGYLRVGFFAIKDIAAGEEITFDYQYERYGEQAQACYCGSSKCRGTLGKKREQTSKAVKSDRDREKARLNDFLATITNEDGGLKDGSRVVKLLQRMVQSKSAYEKDKRERMLDILLATDNVDTLTTFIAKRGLFVFRLWLQDMVLEQQLNLIRKIIRVCLQLPLKTRNPVESAGLPPVMADIRRLDDAVSNELLDEFDARKLETVYVIPEQVVIPTDRVFVPRTQLRDFNRQLLCWLEDQSKAKVELMRLLPGDAELEIRIKGPELALTTARNLIEQVRESFAQRQEAQQQQLLAKQREQQEKEARRLAEAEQAAATAAVPQQRKVSDEPVMFVPSTHVLSAKPLHPNWEQVFDNDERDYYFYNVHTNEVTWNRPIIEPLEEQVQQRSAKRNLQGVELEGQASLNEAILKMKAEKAKAKRPKTAEELEARHLRKFKEKVSPYVIRYLKPHRDKKVKYGFVRNDKDFKFLARKLTHQIVEKERKRRGDVGSLKMTDGLKDKIKLFVKESMKKCGKVFIPPQA
eukprot:m.176632 g.176632  ORF g.176632 m.176632 type:complete len:728 (-) comp16802_c0_seq3:1012-3195(-)